VDDGTRSLAVRQESGGGADHRHVGGRQRARGEGKTQYPPGTRPDGDGHGYHFSPVGGAHTQPGVRRVRGGDLILPMGNRGYPSNNHKLNKIFQFQPNLRPKPTFLIPQAPPNPKSTILFFKYVL
jgi:hypothetical protein